MSKIYRDPTADTAIGNVSREASGKASRDTGRDQRELRDAYARLGKVDGLIDRLYVRVCDGTEPANGSHRTDRSLWRPREGASPWLVCHLLNAVDAYSALTADPLFGSVPESPARCARLLRRFNRLEAELARLEYETRH